MQDSQRSSPPRHSECIGVSDMVKTLCLALSCLAFSSGPGSIQDREAIAAAQRADVGTLDRSLRAAQSFSVWLANVVGRTTKVVWEVNDCGEATGSAVDTGRDLPICAEARAFLSQHREVVVGVAVGTTRKGVGRASGLYYANLVGQDGSTRDAKTLSGLAQLLVHDELSIHFEFGLCWRDVVDTRDDRYTRDLVIDDATTTVRLRLSDAQRRQLAAWVDGSRFFDLPPELDAEVEKDGLATFRIPSETYRIAVTRSGKQHVVEFDDNGDATTGNVVRVRRLAERLKRFFTELPQVKRLPKPPVGCA